MGEVGLKTPNKPPTQRSCRPDDRHDHPSAAARGIAARRRSNRVPRTRSERRDAGSDGGRDKPRPPDHPRDEDAPEVPTIPEGKRRCLIRAPSAPPAAPEEHAAPPQSSPPP